VHGRGVFATRRIRSGARIVEYAGQRVDGSTATARYDDDAMSQHHTFLFQTGPDTFIDAGRGGTEARFINHSCDPNCAAYQEGDRIYIFALRNIQPGTELAYDYALTRPGRLPARWRELYACRCGAANCRGTILKPRRGPRVGGRGSRKKRTTRRR